MLVSYTHKFIYLKPGKTAGTSVEVFLEPLCAPPDHNPSHVTDVIDTEYGIVGERRGSSNTSGFFNHMNAQEIADRLPLEIWSTYSKVATVRNPFDRAISVFHHFGLKSELRSADSDTIISSFRDWVWSVAPGRFTIKKFLFTGEQPCIDYFVRYEDLEGSIRRFLFVLGVDRSGLGPLPRLKTDTRKVSIPLTRYYDAATAAHVREAAAQEFELLGYSTSVEDAERQRWALSNNVDQRLELETFRALVNQQGSAPAGARDLQRLLTKSFRIVERVRGT